MARGFLMDDEELAPYSHHKSAAVELAEIKEQGKRLTDDIVDTVATVGTGAALGWYQGRSGGDMPKVLGVQLDLLTGLALKAVGIYGEMSEPMATSYQYTGSAVDWGRMASSAGNGALTWFFGNYLHAMGKKSHDDAAAAGGGTPVVTAGWTPELGQGNRVNPYNVGFPAYAGYGGR